MLKHLVTAAVLGLFLSFSVTSQADAAPFSPATGLDQTHNAIGSNLTPVHGSGWWAVPAVVGGLILFHEFHRHHRYCCCRTYRKCWWRNGRRYCRRYCRRSCRRSCR
jgi:hypothetical protein